MRNQYEVKSGDLIKGKWTGHIWRVEREIGRGANGIVYLVTGVVGQAALKFADSSSVAAETNSLTALERVRGSSPGPFFIEADDAEQGGAVHPFYIMEYIEGPMLHTFMKQKKQEWAIILLIWLLHFLEALHHAGCVMGDLKPENFIVTGDKNKIRAVDVGGITKFGRSVKEYTALYDRAAWQAGTRKAEPSYDLFGAAVLIAALVHRQPVHQALGDREALVRIIQSSAVLQKIAPVLTKALYNEYDQAVTMRKELLYCFAQSSSSPQKTKRKVVLQARWMVYAGAFAAILAFFLLN
ncbi:protein kinase domain-containing protein [Domibacillus enclensis]|nr:hypothetical protein [Domibacillus enclensis]SIR64946.1 serine/threonine protein kinase [Domibacillus enclensis]